MLKLNQEQREKFKLAISHGFVDLDDDNFMHSFCGTWIRKHPKRVKVLMWMREILGKDPTWEDLSDDFLYDVREEMRDNWAPNSVRTVCAELKAVINSNIESKPIPSRTYRKILSCKAVPVENVYLNPKEVENLEKYEPKSRVEEFVKNIFMRECLTGARNIDCRQMSLANVHEVDGKKLLVYVPIKHPVEVTVPVHKWLEKYLARSYDDLVNMRIAEFNSYLRVILSQVCKQNTVTVYQKGKRVTEKRWKLMASHTGRRTFATYLSANGVPLEQIALLMGHMSGNKPNIEMTAKYVCKPLSISEHTYNLFK